MELEGSLYKLQNFDNPNEGEYEKQTQILNEEFAIKP